MGLLAPGLRLHQLGIHTGTATFGCYQCLHLSSVYIGGGNSVKQNFLRQQRKTFRGRRSITVIRMQVDSKGQIAEGDVSDNKILPFCSVDKRKDKRSLGELESEFLEALQSFYYDRKPIMSNEEFDNLKEELIWEGSSVVILSSDEQKFMEASYAYAAGKPVLNDAEYDELKLKLKRQGSKVAIEGPRCSLRSKKVYSDSTVDYLKMTLLNLPAALIALTLVFFLDDLTGFEITYLLELPEPYSFLFTWFIVLPATYLIARTITNAILKDPLILKGPCPNCGAENNSFFGTILTVPSGGSINDVKCDQCSATLKFDLETRLITIDNSKGAKVATPKKEVVSTTS
ncbi:hypothetical protein O6H91_05G062700 [Diphasiastrum complanatum]|uniref:Uncharacterized protein n=1 Tax=Diphasiastrum complanatum TaxID=34168 RepID=A0ACC2DNT4_DIPCM|nr:hypothetical protein O6H91_05G062700 [Diphasiastrum complanatum]